MLQDYDIMPISKNHKGKKMSEVPDRFLLWLIEANEQVPSNQINPITYDVLDYARRKFKEKE